MRQTGKGLPAAAGLALLLLAAGAGAGAETAAPREARPNIVFILADDMGWGDTGATWPGCKIPTPCLNRLAGEGISFTDAHAGSSLCTPTRYSLLTGRHAWRGALKSGVLGGFAPPLIEEGRLTVASLLRRNGYATACFGKWHLGLGLPMAGNADPRRNTWKKKTGDILWDRPIKPSVLDYGFDTFYGIAGSIGMPPYVWVENDRFAGKGTIMGTVWEGGKRNIGPMDPGYKVVETLPKVTARACGYIRGRKGAARPFFLYLALPAPHAPCVPTEAFKGRTGLGDYADYCVEMDAMVGKVCDALDAAGLRENTLLMFASDNGFWRLLRPELLIAKGHHPSGPYRGYKSDEYEGGHRTPFFVRWPAKIRPGQKLGEPVCISDLMATCADILGARLPDDAGEDSASLLPLLLGKQKGPVHEYLLHHGGGGSLSIRMGKWKLVGYRGRPAGKKGRGRPLSPLQLFDMEADPAEKRSLTAKHPEVVERLLKRLKESIESGRSVPPASVRARARAAAADGGRRP